MTIKKGFVIVLPYFLLLACGYFLFSYWQKSRNLNQLLAARNSELMRANLEIGRAETKIADANTLISKLNKDIQKEIKDRQAVVSLYGELEAKYNAEKKNVKTIVKYVYKDREIEVPKGKFFVKQEDGTLQEISSIRFSYSDFRIDIEGDALQQTLSYKLHQKFKVKIAESKVPSGAINHYVELYEIDDKGQQVEKLKVESFYIVKTQDFKKHMMWWNPKLDLGILLGASTRAEFHWSADLGFSASAYGITENDLLWRFFRLGVQISNRVGLDIQQYGFGLSFSPVQFNLGQYIPLLSNFWILPYGSYDFTSKSGIFGLGFSVVF